VKEQEMNRATRIIVSASGIMLGIAGIDHCFFEALQGNAPTNGLIIQAIGSAHRMWLHGTEEAFTLVPNFLLTGLLAITVSLAIMVWSVGFVHTRHGPTIFILLFVLLFLVGGGIGQIAFFIPVWLVSTRINKPLTGWRNVLPESARRVLGKLWPASLTAVLVLFLIALEIAVFGFVPGMGNGDPELILHICWSFLLGALVMLAVTFAAGFAHDLQP
jgi:hypothetical protein